MLEGQGGNMMLVATPQHTLLVDAQFARMAEAISGKISELGQAPLSYLVNTHFHGDHVGANAYMNETLGATIVAHRNVRTRLAADSEFPRAGLPTVLGHNSLQINLGEYSLTLEHYPTAHTDGDMVVWVEGANIVHVGDLFFVDRFPFVDLNSGGTVQGYINAIAALTAKMDDDTQIVPGHGPLMNKAGYLRLHDMIIETREQVRAWHAAGADVDTMVATGLGEQWADWSWNFINEERWIRTLYNDHLAQ
ncbi:MAG: MBL fold metallo-hydrolase [Idiomarina sp.]|nr:MBL fold metallo-hydrolase [Idiomarina sp.]